jgi:hypothetical protein
MTQMRAESGLSEAIRRKYEAVGMRGTTVVR